MTLAIWAPHPDDEIIGCWSVLNRKHKKDETFVYYFSVDGDLDTRNAQMRFGFQGRYVRTMRNLPREIWDTVLAPDPISDFHPLHQSVGHMAQDLFRAGQINRLILYTTRMTVPYVCEVRDPEAKRDALNHCYPENKSLWETDHRYFLFEGYVEWRRLDCPV